MRAITLTKRVTVAIVAISIVATLVSGAILANYIIPNNSFRVTGSPGVTVFEANGVTAITSIAFGDIQQGSIAQTHQIVIRNTGGQFTVYIIDSTTHSTANGGPVATASSLNPSGLPSGVHLTWDFASLQTAGGQPFNCVVNGVTYTPCMALGQTSGTMAITLSLSADSSAAVTGSSQNFVLEFDAFNSPLG